MNTPVKFEVAKSLKEKGFGKQSNKYYVQVFKDTFKLTHHRMWEMDEESGFQNTSHYPAPTIAEVVMWLYEKHGIWISVTCNTIANGISKFHFSVTFIKDLADERNYDGNNKPKYGSPTEAYEAAIEYTLTKLI